MKKVFLFFLTLSMIFSVPYAANCKEINIFNKDYSSFTKFSFSKSTNELNNEGEYIEVFNYNEKKLFITQSDIDLMAKLVYAESRGEPFDGKVGVVSVVLNRVLDESFPNSIKDVIFEPNAFSCVKNKNINAYPDESCYNAVYSAIKGNDPTNKALFFYNPNLATSSWMINTEKHNKISIGNHVFFSK